VSMTQTTVTVSRATPRVNLLPPEFAEAQRFRKAQAGFAAVLVAAVGVTGLLYMHSHGQIADAQAQVDTVAAQGAALQAESQKYQDVPVVYARADSAEASLREAMALRVQWSDRLDRLSRTIPSNVRLESMALTLTTEPVATPAATPTTPAGPGTARAIGTVTVTGKAKSHDDVAAWLDSQATVEGYADPRLGSSADEKAPGGTVETFNATMTITDKALWPLTPAEGE
jgi:Tfp pilus assembly protein PilN